MKQRVHGRPQCAGSFAVNDPNLTNTARGALLQIRWNQLSEIARLKCMEIQLARDGQRHRSFVGPGHRGRRTHDGFSGASTGGGTEDLGGVAGGVTGFAPGGRIFCSSVGLSEGPPSSDPSPYE